MASYDIKRCPSCNLPYEKNFYSGKPKAEEKIRYGSPIKVCASCGHEFIDKDYKEIALEGVPNMEDYKKFAPGTILYTVLSFVVSFLFRLFDFPFLCLLFIAAGIVIIGSDILTYTKRQQHLEKEILLSKERMKYPSYAKKLAQYGYYVPEEYLISNED